MRKSPMQIVERDPIRWWHVLIGLIVVVLLVLQIADEFAFRDFVAPSFRRVPLFPLYPGDPGAWFGACFNAIWYFLSQHLGPLALAGMLMLIRSKAGVAS